MLFEYFIFISGWSMSLGSNTSEREHKWSFPFTLKKIKKYFFNCYFFNINHSSYFKSIIKEALNERKNNSFDSRCKRLKYLLGFFIEDNE